MARRCYAQQLECAIHRSAQVLDSEHDLVVGDERHVQQEPVDVTGHFRHARLALVAEWLR